MRVSASISACLSSPSILLRTTISAWLSCWQNRSAMEFAAASDASLAIVDTPLLLAGHFDARASDAAANSIADLFCQQLSHADIVVLNKIDGLDKHALIEAETRIRALAPSVRFIELAYQARLESQLTLGLHLHTAAQPIHAHRQPTSTQASSGLSRPLDGHSHSGLAPHLHGLTTHTHFHEHDPGWQSFVLNCP